MSRTFDHDKLDQLIRRYETACREHREATAKATAAQAAADLAAVRYTETAAALRLYYDVDIEASARLRASEREEGT